jgi:hypothetical protein
VGLACASELRKLLAAERIELAEAAPSPHVAAFRISVIDRMGA